MVLFAILLALVAFSTTLFFARASYAAPGTTKTVSFQGRLRAASGAVVPDGFYNIQFKLYEGGDGLHKDNPGGALKWTEDYLNAGTESGVDVRNGFFTVNLGSHNPFGSKVDWNQDVLWLSMNVAGLSPTCDEFDAAGCKADGEMLPMKQISAAPYAINSGMLTGKTADNFIQLAQGVQTDASTNTSSIFVNKTGTGNLVQLQSNAADIFTIKNTGSIAFGSTTNQSISVVKSADETSGRELAITAGEGGNGAGTAGGNLVLQGGNAGGTNGHGGNITIDAGAGTGTGTGGNIAIGGTNANEITIGGGSNVTVSNNTSTTYFGNGAISAAPGDYKIQGTDSAASGVAGGTLTVQGGNATTGDTNGGNLVLSGGSGSGTGAEGRVTIGKNDDTKTTLLQLDSSSQNPGTNASLVGSMYYDTAIGRVQCYEATGWGSCGASPDNFITLTPEYANSVNNGSTSGTLTSDFCSSTLAINDGSGVQPEVCSANETYNFYKWTTPSSSDQVRTMFVTYKLPDNFQKFIENSTSLMGRTDDAKSAIEYQIYKNTSGTLTPCGSTIDVSTGAQTEWKKASAETTTDPANCNFAAGDSIVFKISLKAKDNTNAYISNLSFAITNR